MARDVYTRRQEGVSIWVVPSAAITASNPDDKGRAVRSGRRQDLPSSDLLLRSRKSGARMAERACRYLLHPLADNAVVLGQRNAEWCGHEIRSSGRHRHGQRQLDYIGQSRLLCISWRPPAWWRCHRGQAGLLRDETQFRNYTLLELPLIRPAGRFMRCPIPPSCATSPAPVPTVVLVWDALERISRSPTWRPSLPSP